MGEFKVGQEVKFPGSPDREFRVSVFFQVGFRVAGFEVSGFRVQGIMVLGFRVSGGAVAGLYP